MQDAHLFGQLAATLFLTLFSLGLGYRLRHLGFGFHGLRECRIEYEKRRQTRVGQKARRPLLIRHSESPWYIAGWTLFLLAFNGALLLWLYWRGLYVLVPAIAIPVALVEFGLGRWIEKERFSVYEADYAEYLRLTAPGNRSIVGQVRDWDSMPSDDGLISSRLLSGGKIVTAMANRQGQLKTLRLFCPLGRMLPPEDEAVRVFYLPRESLQSQAIDGELVGFQVRPPSPVKPSYEELERRIAAKY